MANHPRCGVTASSRETPQAARCNAWTLWQYMVYGECGRERTLKCFGGFLSAFAEDHGRKPVEVSLGCLAMGRSLSELR